MQGKALAKAVSIAQQIQVPNVFTIMLNVITLNVIMLSVVMLSAVEPFPTQ